MRALGLVCLAADGEAEALAAALTRVGAAHAVVGSDADALTYGATALYRRLHLVRAPLRDCMLERCVCVRIAQPTR